MTFLMGFWKETKFLLYTYFIKKQPPRGRLPCPKVCRGLQQRQIQNIADPLCIITCYSIFYIYDSMLHSSARLLFGLAVVLCLISFQSAASVQQPSQNVSVSSFLCLSAATFFISLCHNFSGPLQYSMKDDIQRQFHTMREVLRGKVYGSIRDPRRHLCKQSNKQPYMDLKHRD